VSRTRRIVPGSGSCASAATDEARPVERRRTRRERECRDDRRSENGIPHCPIVRPLVRIATSRGRGPRPACAS
jgi:hypothetical protein